MEKKQRRGTKVTVAVAIIIIFYLIGLIYLTKNQIYYKVEFSSNVEEVQIDSNFESDVYKLQFLIKNCGNRFLSSEKQFFLTYHLYDSEHNTIQYENTYSNIPDLYTGDIKQAELNITVPDEPGEYYIAVDMVSEDVGFFSDIGTKLLVIPVSVAEDINNDEEER